ncbi:MAG: flagellar hook-basal body complex protein FliE [Vicinamibacterales bacterium]|nr:flagellar hook-basal body complex protein FliE [Vicinamibacterales bacterium]
MAIEQIGRSGPGVPGAGKAGGTGGVTGGGEGGFESSLKRLVESAAASGAEANTAVSDMLSGTGEVHDAMIALQRAELTLQLTMQVRNKLVNAYAEIMRMPV